MDLSGFSALNTGSCTGSIIPVKFQLTTKFLVRPILLAEWLEYMTRKCKLKSVIVESTGITLISI